MEEKKTIRSCTQHASRGLDGFEETRVLRYTEDSVLLRRHDPALSHNDVVLREKTAFNVHAKEASASKRV